jgi:DNA-directed RNA polymerase subunit RPC12/RpoP
MGPIALASALGSGLTVIECPHCGHTRFALRGSGAWLVCLRCRRKYVDPRIEGRTDPNR